jgi:hypothetical protein
MALIKCRECGRDISNQAKSCPQCGAKVKKPVGPLGIFVVLVLAAVVVSSFFISQKETETQAKQAQALIVPCDQKAADKALSKMGGLWYQSKGETVLIREPWYGLPIDQKRTFDALFHCAKYGHKAHVQNLVGPLEVTIYKDYRTGKDVAQSSSWLGFKME